MFSYTYQRMKIPDVYTNLELICFAISIYLHVITIRKSTFTFAGMFCQRSGINSSLLSYKSDFFLLKMLRNSISFLVFWIPRNKHNLIFPRDMGPHTINRSASVRNMKLRRFNPLFSYSDFEVVDDFTQNWRFENDRLIPPIRLASRATNHIIMCKLFQNGHQEPSGY